MPRVKAPDSADTISNLICLFSSPSPSFTYANPMFPIYSSPWKTRFKSSDNLSSHLYFELQLRFVLRRKCVSRSDRLAWLFVVFGFSWTKLLKILFDVVNMGSNWCSDRVRLSWILFDKFFCFVTDDHFCILELDQFRILLKFRLQFKGIFLTPAWKQLDESWQLCWNTGLY